MKRKLLLGLGLVVLVAGFFGARAGLRRLAFFSVRRIELVGARYLDPAVVARVLQLRDGASVFDSRDEWTAKVRELPGVLDADIGIRLPGTLRVKVREAEPVALAERGDRLVLVNEAGQVLPFDPARPAADLPLASADSLVTRVLGRIRDIDPDLFDRIQRASRTRGDVALDLEAGRLYLRSGAEAEDIQAVSLVADLLSRNGKSWRELDGRFPPRVIIRGGGGQA